MLETSIQPVQAVKPTPAELPTFTAGERFTAQIERMLPDGTFKAVVAGKSVTLSLPQSAQAGDTLELIVTNRSSRVVFAQQAPHETTTSPPANLSRTAQMISALFGNRQDGTPRAPISNTSPLLPQPPNIGTTLAPVLRQALSQSGLFYESHQAQWVSGRLPLSQLLQEPQGQHSPILRNDSTPPLPNASRPAAPTPEPPQQTQIETTSRTLESQANTTIRHTALNPLPADLAPIVQQQLDTAATQQVLWQGQPWPGQMIEWEVRREEKEDGQGDADTPQWSTRLSLKMPQLGALEADLKLSARGLQIVLNADASQTAQLEAGKPELAAALEASGIPLLAMLVKSHESETG